MPEPIQKNPYSLIPATPEARQAEVDRVSKRYSYSSRYHAPWFEKWVRYYKIWRCISEAVDAIEEQDEPDTFVPYAFSVIEDLHAKSAEPIFRMGLPLQPKPMQEGHELQAERFAAVARAHYTDPEWQIGYMSAGKERVITGNMWERDSWADDWAKEQRWSFKEQPTVVDVLVDWMSKLLPTKMAQMQRMPVLEEALYPRRVGFRTEFPSVFHVLPEPGVSYKNFHRMMWLIEEEPSVPISQLQEQKFRAPGSKALLDVYDLTELLADKRGTIMPLCPVEGREDYFKQARLGSSGAEESPADGGAGGDDGVDRVHLAHEYAKDGTLTTVANGKFLIRKVKLPVAKIPLRLRVWAMDPQNLLGIGAIEPAEDLFMEENDIHNLSIANWVRIINRMMAINADQLVSPEDLKPRAGGYIRFSGNVHQAIRELHVPDVVNSMLTMKSSNEGMIERATNSADFSPGVGGTKQHHDTATGLLEIKAAVAARGAMMRRIDMAQFKDQLWMMERYFSFYQFTPMPFEAISDDGATTMMEISNEHIDTGGKGFRYSYEHDPSFGDEFIQRHQQKDFLQSLFDFAKLRVDLGKENEWPEPDIPNVIRKHGKTYGFEDTTFFLKPADGLLTPEQELKIMINGGQVQVHPQENLSGHLRKHLQDRNNPAFLQAVSTGKIPKEVKEALDAHIQETFDGLKQVIAQPGAFAEADRHIAARARAVRGAAPEATA